jgi:hypothetical protein
MQNAKRPAPIALTLVFGLRRHVIDHALLIANLLRQATELFNLFELIANEL